MISLNMSICGSILDAEESTETKMDQTRKGCPFKIDWLVHCYAYIDPTVLAMNEKDIAAEDD